jgi:hypothetical protein
VQNVFGVNGQKRRGPAKQHREQIQRDDAENNTGAENEAKPAEKRFQR